MRHRALRRVTDPYLRARRAEVPSAALGGKPVIVGRGNSRRGSERLQALPPSLRHERFQLRSVHLLKLFERRRRRVLHAFSGHPKRLVDPRDQRLGALQVSGGCRVAEQAHRLMDLLRLLRQRSRDDGSRTQPGSAPQDPPRSRALGGTPSVPPGWSDRCTDFARGGRSLTTRRSLTTSPRLHHESTLTWKRTRCAVGRPEKG